MTSTAQDDALNADLEQRTPAGTLQLEATARELDAFGATLSHDLRAPLRSIEGFSRLLLQPQYAQQLDTTGQDYLQRIHRASLKLSQMMNELLQVVRLAQGGVTSERVDLSRMARDILAALQAQAPSRRADIAVEPDIVVTGDARLLRLALENLLDNAWKFTSKNEFTNIFFGREMDEGAAAICVRDNGAGFEQKYANRLFHAFQRLHTEAEFGGNGIGLAKAQRVMHAHGGRIWARAQRGSGAAFYFTLPGVTAAPRTNLANDEQ